MPLSALPRQTARSHRDRPEPPDERNVQRNVALESPKLEVREITVSAPSPATAPMCTIVDRAERSRWVWRRPEVPLDKLSLIPAREAEGHVEQRRVNSISAGNHRELLEPQRIVMAFEDVENGTDVQSSP